MTGRGNSISSRRPAGLCICPGRAAYPRLTSSTSSPNDEQRTRRFQGIPPMDCREFLSSLRLYHPEGQGNRAGYAAGRRRPRRLLVSGAREGTLARQDTLAGASGSRAISRVATEARTERGRHPILPIVFAARDLGLSQGRQRVLYAWSIVQLLSAETEVGGESLAWHAHKENLAGSAGFGIAAVDVSHQYIPLFQQCAHEGQRVRSGAAARDGPSAE